MIEITQRKTVKNTCLMHPTLKKNKKDGEKRTGEQFKGSY